MRKLFQIANIILLVCVTSHSQTDNTYGWKGTKLRKLNRIIVHFLTLDEDCTSISANIRGSCNLFSNTCLRCSLSFVAKIILFQVLNSYSKEKYLSSRIIVSWILKWYKEIVQVIISTESWPILATPLVVKQQNINYCMHCSKITSDIQISHFMILF